MLMRYRVNIRWNGTRARFLNERSPRAEALYYHRRWSICACFLRLIDITLILPRIVFFLPFAASSPLDTQFLMNHCSFNSFFNKVGNIRRIIIMYRIDTWILISFLPLFAKQASQIFLIDIIELESRRGKTIFNFSIRNYYYERF